MIKSLIVAKTQNNVIGKNNRLLWHLPNDLKYFKKITLGNPVIMGRKNYLSLPEKYRPLPNRINIVLTRQKGFIAPGCVIMNSIEDAIKFCEEQNHKECFIIGGGEIYKQVLEKNLVDKMYITEVHSELEGDTFFPSVDLTQWKKVFEKFNPSDATHPFDYTFVVYEKITNFNL